MAWLIPLLNAIVAVPKIGEMFERWIGFISAWYVGRQQGETLRLIVDAAALGARAKTQDDRVKVADAWQKALTRSRVS